MHAACSRKGLLRWESIFHMNNPSCGCTMRIGRRTYNDPHPPCDRVSNLHASHQCHRPEGGRGDWGARARRIALSDYEPHNDLMQRHHLRNLRQHNGATRTSGHCVSSKGKCNICGANRVFTGQPESPLAPCRRARPKEQITHNTSERKDGAHPAKRRLMLLHGILAGKKPDKHPTGEATGPICDWRNSLDFLRHHRRKLDVAGSYYPPSAVLFDEHRKPMGARRCRQALAACAGKISDDDRQMHFASHAKTQMSPRRRCLNKRCKHRECP